MTHFWATFEVEFPPHLTYKLNIDDAMDHLDFLELRLVRLRDLTESPLLITLLPFFWKFLSVYSCSSSILPADIFITLLWQCDELSAVTRQAVPALPAGRHPQQRHGGRQLAAVRGAAPGPAPAPQPRPEAELGPGGHCRPRPVIGPRPRPRHRVVGGGLAGGAGPPGGVAVRGDLCTQHWPRPRHIDAGSRQSGDNIKSIKCLIALSTSSNGLGDHQIASSVLEGD